jgi:hypothetical protein
MTRCMLKPVVTGVTRLALCFVLSSGIWLTGSTRVAAHRLDEYLQATRIAVGSDVVSVEIDLTAGVAIAPKVFAWIDSDGDGQLSAPEREAYAMLVVSSAVLEIDGRRHALVVAGSQFPSWQDMNTGIGAIRLKAVTKLPAELAGAHRLYYRNTHRADASVYLVNALVPPEDIQITGQRRDTGQHELWLDYGVGSKTGTPWARAWRIAGGLGLVAFLAGMRGRYRRRTTAACL